jgi:hypothetical protein
MIQPIKGMNQSSRYHALRSVSCSRRAPTARDGSRIAREKSPDKVSLTMPAVADARKVNRNYYQNSDREARLSNVAYLEKLVLMDSPKVIWCLLIFVYGKDIGAALRDSVNENV